MDESRSSYTLADHVNEFANVTGRLAITLSAVDVPGVLAYLESIPSTLQKIDFLEHFRRLRDDGVETSAEGGVARSIVVDPSVSNRNQSHVVKPLCDRRDQLLQEYFDLGRVVEAAQLLDSDALAVRFLLEIRRDLYRYRPTILKRVFSGWEYPFYNGLNAELEYRQRLLELAAQSTPQIVVHTGDRYHVDQAGAVGPNSHAHDMTFGPRSAEGPTVNGRDKRLLSYPPVPPHFYDPQHYSLLFRSAPVDREKELSEIHAWLDGSDRELATTRVGVLVGIGGEGKSVIAARVYHDIERGECRTKFDGGFWWSFYYPDSPDTSMDRFSVGDLTKHLYAYLERVALEDSALISPVLREQRILYHLNQRRLLLVLDGLERVLVAYSSMYSAYLSDLDVDARLALADALGLGSDSAELPARRRQRSAVDHRMGLFLQRLARTDKSRTLITTRLFPGDLDAVAGVPIDGARAWRLSGLSVSGVSTLLSSLGCRVTHGEARAFTEAVGGHPLTVSLVAKEVANSEPPGDFAAWSRTNRDSLVDSLAVDERIERTVKAILRNLDDNSLAVLQTIAMFRAPVAFETLKAILVGPTKRLASVARLHRHLTNLSDRGFTDRFVREERHLGAVSAESVYEVHPAIRSLVRSSADRDQWGEIASGVYSHVSAFTIPTIETVASLDDLGKAITTFHCLLEAARFKEAFGIYYNRLMGPLHFRLSAIDTDISLLLALARHARSDLDAFTPPDCYHILAKLSIAYCLVGSPNEAYATIMEASVVPVDPAEKQQLLAARLINEIPSLIRIGRLQSAYANARTAIRHSRKHDDRARELYASIHLGLIQSIRGKYSSAARLLSRIVRSSLMHNDRHSASLASGHLVQTLTWSGQLSRAELTARALLEGERQRPWVRRDLARALHLLALVIARSSGGETTSTARISEGLTLANEALEVSSNLGIGDYEIDARLVRARLLLLSGDLDLATDEARTVERQARQGGYQFKLAEALQVLGQSLENSGGDGDRFLVEARLLASSEGPDFSCAHILSGLPCG